MKDNYYWILLGIAVGIIIYLGDKYIFQMKKILAIVVLGFLWCNNSYSDIKSDAKEMIERASACYSSLPSYAQKGAVESYLDAMTYWNDAVKEDNMGDPRRLASAFYRNAIAYSGVVLQIGNAYRSKACRP